MGTTVNNMNVKVSSRPVRSPSESAGVLLCYCILRVFRGSTRLAVAGLSVLCVFAALAAPVHAAGNRYALVIGINDYELLGKLEYCRQDAEAIAKILLERGGYDAARVCLVTDADTRRAFQPTYTTLLRRLEQFTSLPREGDTLLIFFAGHGLTIDDDGYLMPVDGADSRTGFSITWLKDRIAQCGASNKILILDACHSGKAARGVLGVAPDLTRGAATLVLSSCAARQISYPEDGHGVFTSALLKGLSGLADGNKDGHITGDELFASIRNHLEEWAIRTGKTQTPQMYPEIEGGIVIASLEHEILQPHWIPQELYEKVIATIEENYVRPIRIDQSKSPDVNDVLRQLGPYCQFFDAREANGFQSNADGEFGGVGMEIAIVGNVFMVVAPVYGSPAWQGGVMAGDQILTIDGEDTRGLTLERAVRLIRGNVGKKVELGLSSPDSDQVRNVVLVRAIIRPPSVESGILHEKAGIGWIRIPIFAEASTDQFRSELFALRKKGLRALTLDLRQNPGGLLNRAIEIADILIASGTITEVSSRGQAKFFRAHNDFSEYERLPIAILVDEGTASAGEILAAALRDNGRGTIIGNKTYGKGSVVQVIPFEDGSILKLAVAQYVRPNGNPILDKEGLLPDIKVSLTHEDVLRLREAERNAKINGDDPPLSAIKADPVVHRAVELLERER